MNFLEKHNSANEKRDDDYFPLYMKQRFMFEEFFRTANHISLNDELFD